jgi:hypothetical protein
LPPSVNCFVIHAITRLSRSISSHLLPLTSSSLSAQRSFGEGRTWSYSPLRVRVSLHHPIRNATYKERVHLFAEADMIFQIGCQFPLEVVRVSSITRRVREEGLARSRRVERFFGGKGRRRLVAHIDLRCCHRRFRESKGRKMKLMKTKLTMNDEIEAWQLFPSNR